MDYNFLNKWHLEKHEIDYAKTYIDCFIKSTNSQLFIQKLFDNYTYYSSSNFENIVKTFCFKLREYLKENSLSQNIVICLPFEDTKLHNSFYFGNKLKKYGLNIHNTIDYGEISKIDCFIIADDYCGSGNHLTEALKIIDGKIKDKKIIVAPLVATSTAFRNLELLKMSNNEYIFLSDICTRKEDRYLTEKNILSKNELDAFKYSNKLLEIPEDATYGYNDIEDLVSFNYFTPNDTLGIFWEKSAVFPNPLFSRDSEFEYTIKNNYQKSKILHSFYKCLNGKTPLKIRYICVISMILITKGYDIALSITRERVDNFNLLIESCKKNNLLKNESGIYVEGAQFYNYVNKCAFTIKKIFCGTFSLEEQISAKLDSLK